MDTEKSNANYEEFISETLPLLKQVAKAEHIPHVDMPFNDMSNIHFSGYNKTKLMLSAIANNFNDNRWISEKQLAEKYPDLHIPNEAKPTKILLSQRNYHEKDSEGKSREISQEDFEARRLEAFKNGEKANAFYVFNHTAHNIYNVSQIPNYPKQEINHTLKKEDAHELIDNFIASSGVKVAHTNKENSVYNHDEDVIEMTSMKFSSKEEYYSRLLENYFIATGKKDREDRKIETFNDVFAEAVRSTMFSLLAGSHVGLDNTQEEAEKLVDLVQKSSYTDEQLMKASYEANKILSLLEQYSTGDTVQAHWFPEAHTWQELIDEAQEEAQSPMPESWLSDDEKAYLEANSKTRKSLHFHAEEGDRQSSHVVVVRMYLDVSKEEKDEAKKLGARWDNAKKSWYTTSDNPNNPELLKKWQVSDKAKPSQDNRIYLNVPKAEKDSAKALGAKWDNETKSWYTTSDNPNNQELFEKWDKPKAESKEAHQSTQAIQRIYINVPKEERDEAKALGAKWDRTAVSWYTSPDNPHYQNLLSLYSKSESTTLVSKEIEKAHELFSDKDFIKEISTLSDNKKFQAALNTITETLSNAVASQKQGTRQRMG